MLINEELLNVKIIFLNEKGKIIVETYYDFIVLS